MTTKPKWSAKVDTDSTHPGPGLFKKSPAAIATALASNGSLLRDQPRECVCSPFISTGAGKNLTPGRRQALTKAKTLLSKIIAEHKEKSETNRSTQKSTSTKASQKPTRKNTTTSHTKQAA